MGRIIGKVLATEKNPSTMEEFYFWTKPEICLLYTSQTPPWADYFDNT